MLPVFGVPNFPKYTTGLSAPLPPPVCGPDRHGKRHAHAALTQATRHVAPAWVFPRRARVPYYQAWTASGGGTSASLRPPSFSTLMRPESVLLRGAFVCTGVRTRYD